ncbi:MAG: type II toxin-antitoxin system PemK/MazF family toxin [Rhodoferax sp.]|nr:type II toxin-antitoxin system PemK/MazF family toxin [Rhodoferax sp.]
MTRASAMKQGDIVRIALDPTAGTELRGTRPVLVLSNAEFNRGGRALIAPVTQGGNIGRIEGWAVTLMGAGMVTQGVVVVSHCRVIDLAARGAKLIEAAPASIVEDVLAKLQAMVE